jgi:hypothetical protein
MDAVRNRMIKFENVLTVRPSHSITPCLEHILSFFLMCQATLHSFLWISVQVYGLASSCLLLPSACLQVGTFTLGIYAVVAGVLGENLPIVPQSLVTGKSGFVLVNALVTLMCLLVFFSIVFCAHRNGLM